MKGVEKFDVISFILEFVSHLEVMQMKEAKETLMVLKDRLLDAGMPPESRLVQALVTFPTIKKLVALVEHAGTKENKKRMGRWLSKLPLSNNQKAWKMSLFDANNRMGRQFLITSELAWL